MPTTIIKQVSRAVPPTFTSFWKLNSRPSENKSTTMPNWAQKLMLAGLATVGRNLKCGLAMKPATM